MTACITAGAIVGTVNIIITRFVVVSRFRLLTSRMSLVQKDLMKAVSGGDLSNCTPEKCHIAVTSNDEIGESAVAFNSLVDVLSASIST